MRRVLDIASGACLAVGVWRHDWTLIVSAAALLLLWKGISDEVHAVSHTEAADDDLAESA